MTDKQKAILEILKSLNYNGYGIMNNAEIIVERAIQQYRKLVEEEIFTAK